MQPQSRHLQGFSPGDLPSHPQRTLGFYTHQKSLWECPFINKTSFFVGSDKGDPRKLAFSRMTALGLHLKVAAVN
jgi:hypothetical protein